jgi:inosine-uridine nucleoside N-ribohydrolase
VILDTDIGGDIDDTWALAMLLRSPELDLKLVVTDTGDTIYRARVAAKLLEHAGRAEVPVAVGLRQGEGEGPQAPWVEDYELADYEGEVFEKGVDALIETIMDADEAVTLIAIGPVPNVAAALAREPRIAENARFVGMHGSVRLGYGGSSTISAEYNVKADVPACRQAFAAPWEVTITPLDTCGLVQLDGAKYEQVRDSEDPLARAVMENYRIWAPRVDWASFDPRMRSSVLFDTVAVYLAFSDDLLEIEDLPIHVTDDGYTVVEQGGHRIRCATRWRDLAAFEDLLVERLTETS